MNNSITIPLEQYEDLICTQMKLEQLITARNNFYFSFEENGARIFDAIVGRGF